MTTKKKVAPKKVAKKEEKVISKSVEKRVKIQKEEVKEVEAPKVVKPKYPTIDGLLVIDVLSSTPTEKECMMSDGTTRFVEAERFDK